MTEHILLRHRDIPNLDQIDVYRAHGGFEAFHKAVTTMKPAEVLNEVKASGLRGRGGAGFPTGVKWSFIPNNLWPHYVVANADESEPGTFKDREIMEGNPYQFLEGLMIASCAVQAQQAYVYLRGEFWQQAASLDACIEALEKADLLGDGLFGTDYSLHIHTHLGAGAYVCGEETALLESIEGKAGQPRLRPPFPAVYGLYGRPTVINNVETLANVPPIIQNGSDWYKTIGTEKSPGVKLFSLSGCVNRPGNYELPLGATFRELIETCGGGILEGHKLKAVMTAGASSSIVPYSEKLWDVPLDYESVQQLMGCPLGSASFIIIDDTVNIGWLVSKTISFFKHESCGKCTPCREGTFWSNQIAKRMTTGKATLKDIDLLLSINLQIQGKCLCPLGEFSVMSVISGIQNFREDFETLITHPADVKPAGKVV